MPNKHSELTPSQHASIGAVGVLENGCNVVERINTSVYEPNRFLIPSLSQVSQGIGWGPNMVFT